MEYTCLYGDGTEESTPSFQEAVKKIVERGQIGYISDREKTVARVVPSKPIKLYTYDPKVLSNLHLDVGEIEIISKTKGAPQQFMNNVTVGGAIHIGDIYQSNR